MNPMIAVPWSWSWRTLCAVALLALLSGCGGGGGGLDPIGGEGPPVADDGSATGSLGITVGDNPARDFDEILITVNSVAIIGDDDEDPLLLSEEPFTFDLLALEAATELLLAVDDVPVGSYNKIRLQLDSIVLNQLDEDGEVTRSENARLVANGKLDLNPRGPFEIAEGRVVIVQLDIRAGPAFLITPGAGPIIFRPVVFVDILGDADVRRITFLTGRIQLLADPEDENAFELCDARALTGRGAGDRQLGECRRIDLASAEDEETVFFDRDGNPIEFGAVDDQAPAIVAGRLLAVDGRLGFEALMVQLGERSDFKRIRGVLADDLADDRFRLRDRSDPEHEGLFVQVQPGALLFDQRGELLDTSVLTEGTRVRAMGLLIPGSGDEETRLLATAIAVEVEPADEDEQTTLRGQITAIDDNRIDLMLEEGGTGCAVFSNETTFTEVTTTEDGQSVTNVTAEALAVEQLIEVIGTEGENGCVAAMEIIIEIEAAEAEEEEEEEENGENVA